MMTATTATTATTKRIEMLTFDDNERVDAMTSAQLENKIWCFNLLKKDDNRDALNLQIRR